MTKKEITILMNNPENDKDYIKFLEKRFTVKLLDEKSQEIPDLILFTGGADVNPSLYNENVNERTFYNNKRDSLDLKLFDKYKYHNILRLGICRGSQFLTVMANGKLIQHVQNHTSNHTIQTNTGKVYDITSTHHQMMNPFVLDEEEFDLIAFSEYFRSVSYLNGDNEHSELLDNFLEPEIVFYKKINSLCIQGHPEFENCNKNTQEYCLDLIEQKINKK